MAIDKARTLDLIGSIRASFDALAKGIPEPTRDWLREKIVGSAIGELEDLILESRPPVLYLLGRSGHGKSTLLNALAGREVAKVGHVRPQTPGADPHLIRFEEVFSEWLVVDARGIFETPRKGGADGDPVEQAKEDIRRFRPDVLLHVVAASEARTLSNDFRVLKEIRDGVERDFGAPIPTVMVLTKVDLLGDPDAWPPSDHPGKAALIKELLDYVGSEILAGRSTRINPNWSLAGDLLEDTEYVGILPVAAMPSRQWNVGTLADFIGQHLPTSAILDYAQGLQRKELLRRLSTKLTRRFSSIASVIGMSPTPVADIVVLTPLQVLLVTLIGGLSCRRVSPETVAEFTAATGVNVGFAVAAREGARAAIKLLPAAGMPLSGAVAGATTYGIGKSAEAYFFSGEVRQPLRFMNRWRRDRGTEAPLDG